MAQEKNKPLGMDLAILLSAHIFAYLWYRHILEFPFDIKGILTDSMHYLAVDWLREDLLLSLWYLHTNPPLANLLWGIIFKWWPEHYALVLEAIYFLAGMAGVLCLFFAMARLGIGRWLRLAVCFSLYLIPTFFMYGTWAYTTHLEFCLSAAALYFLAGLYTRPDPYRNLIKLFVVFAILGLLRSQWHLVVFIGFAFVLERMKEKITRRQIAACSLIFILPLGGWYAKNEMVFGFFGPSSWMGATLAQAVWPVIMINDLAPEVEQMRKRQEISTEFSSDLTPMKILRHMPPETMQPFIHHPSLAPYKPGYGDGKYYFNYNYAGILFSARQDLKDSLTLIEKYPLAYLERVGKKIWDGLWIPSMNYNINEKTYLYIRFPPGQGYYSALKYGSFFLYGVIPLALGILALSGRAFSPSWRKFILSSCYLLLIMLLISYALNNPEQTRMRWGWAPFYLCFAAMMLHSMQCHLAMAWANWRSRRHPCLS